MALLLPILTAVVSWPAGSERGIPSSWGTHSVYCGGGFCDLCNLHFARLLPPAALGPCLAPFSLFATASLIETLCTHAHGMRLAQSNLVCKHR